MGVKINKYINMIQYQITIISKNKNSLKNFFIFFNQILKNFNKIKKYLKKKHEVKILTILKSPHVNKTAQEQFETRLYISQIVIYYSPKNLQLLIFLKKFKIFLFPDIKIKIKFYINKSSIKKTQSELLNPNNFQLNFFEQQLKNQTLKNTKYYKTKQYYKKMTMLKRTEALLKIFDTYGNSIIYMFR